MAALVVDPVSASLAPGGVTQFRVTDPTPPPESIDWSVRCSSGFDPGTIDNQGKYAAPATATMATEVIVTARAGDSEGTATVTITPAVASPTQEETSNLTPPSRDQSAKPADPSAPQSSPQRMTDQETDPKQTNAPEPGRGQPVAAIVIEPASVVLAAKGAQLFTAKDGSGQPVAVTWSLLGTGGLPADIVGSIDAVSGTYTAPAEIASERNVIVLASTANGDVDKAFVALTRGAVRVVPAEVTLRAKEQQRFTVLVQGDAENAVDWQTSPLVGKLDPTNLSTVFTAPDALPEDSRVLVTAISKKTGQVGSASVSLIADPWLGWGPTGIGMWLLMLAVVVPFLYLVWPPPSTFDRSTQATLQAAADAANRLVQQREEAVSTLTKSLENLQSKQRAAASATPPNPTAASGLQSQIDAMQASLTAATELRQDARRDSEAKLSAVKMETDTQKQNKADERVLFLLVLLAGALGSFVHTTRSFVDFMGNRRLRASWTWWYVLQPFTGASLAMVTYLVVRAGFFATTTGATALNPWGFVAVASLVGLFSKQATNKLDELFSTMFRTDKDRELRDKLNPGNMNSAQK
jgi:hypothetical protein